MNTQEAIDTLNELKKLCKRNYIDPTKYIKAIDIGISAIQIMIGEYTDEQLEMRDK